MIELLKILVVDDDDLMLELFAYYFDYLKVNYKVFSNPLEALDYTMDKKNKGVLMGMGFFDYSMPEMNGYELANKIKVIDKNIPLILITGQNFNKYFDPTSVGFLDVLKKPFRVSEIEQTLLKYHRNSSILKDKLLK